jgi:hypothetical protein
MLGSIILSKYLPKSNSTLLREILFDILIVEFLYT